MHNRDELQRFVFENASVRGEVVHLNNSYCAIIDLHQYPPLIRHLLGEALVAVSLLCAIIKFKGRLTLQFQGKGKLKLLVAQCSHQFHLRGLAQWQGVLTAAELLSELQQGTINIIIASETGKQNYQGIVEWQGNSFAQSIEGYFKNSEQLATRIWIAVDDHTAAGLLLQVMPKESTGFRHGKVEETENHWEHLTHLAATVTQKELLSLNHETLLHRLYVQEEVRIFEPMVLQFQCTCSLERSKNAILLLGQEEIAEELKDKKKIVVTCEFCSKEYSFDRVDIEALFKRRGTSQGSQQIQ